MPAGSVVLGMQAVVFIGIQGSGKTSFYAERFLKTHVRISLDLLKTRGKEARFLQLCLDTGQKFVMDNIHRGGATPPFSSNWLLL
jgi:predicted kinase